MFGEHETTLTSNFVPSSSAGSRAGLRWERSEREGKGLLGGVIEEENIISHLWICGLWLTRVGDLYFLLPGKRLDEIISLCFSFMVIITMLATKQLVLRASASQSCCHMTKTRGRKTNQHAGPG